jgi:hypothetical protein
MEMAAAALVQANVGRYGWRNPSFDWADDFTTMQWEQGGPERAQTEARENLFFVCATADGGCKANTAASTNNYFKMMHAPMARDVATIAGPVIGWYVRVSVRVRAGLVLREGEGEPQPLGTLSGSG